MRAVIIQLAISSSAINIVVGQIKFIRSRFQILKPLPIKPTTKPINKLIIMKVIVCLASFIAVASASHLVAPAAVIPAAVSTGVSSQYRSQNSVGDYTFGYNEDHPTGGSFRREAGNLAGKTGSYGLRDIDGRTRIVNYVADAAGFRASIQTNEPGVEPKDPAATLINKAVAVGKSRQD